MKHLIALIITLSFLVACTKGQMTNVQVSKVDTVYKTDTIYVPFIKKDTCKGYDKKIVDSLKSEVFLREFKINKVKYYLKIVDKKPSQIKFLKGWVRRAVQ